MTGRNITESDIETFLKDKLEAEGFLVLKLQTPAYSGTPDRMILWPRYAPSPPIFVELKRPDKKPRPLQAAVQKDWLMRGADVHTTVSNYIEAKQLIDKLLSRSKMKKELYTINRGDPSFA